LGRDGGDIDLIWVRREQKYFCRQDWTASISLNRFNKIASAFSDVRAAGWCRSPDWSAAGRSKRQQPQP
jgi:hypothetical protein